MESFCKYCVFSLHPVAPGLLGQLGVAQPPRSWSPGDPGEGIMCCHQNTCVGWLHRHLKLKPSHGIQHLFCPVWPQSEHFSWALRDIIEEYLFSHVFCF